MTILYHVITVKFLCWWMLAIDKFMGFMQMMTHDPYFDYKSYIYTYICWQLEIKECNDKMV